MFERPAAGIVAATLSFLSPAASNESARTSPEQPELKQTDSLALNFAGPQSELRHDFLDTQVQPLQSKLPTIKELCADFRAINERESAEISGAVSEILERRLSHIRIISPQSDGRGTRLTGEAGVKARRDQLEATKGELLRACNLDPNIPSHITVTEAGIFDIASKQWTHTTKVSITDDKGHWLVQTEWLLREGQLRYVDGPQTQAVGERILAAKERANAELSQRVTQAVRADMSEILSNDRKGQPPRPEDSQRLNKKFCDALGIDPTTSQVAIISRPLADPPQMNVELHSRSTGKQLASAHFATAGGFSFSQSISADPIEVLNQTR